MTIPVDATVIWNMNGATAGSAMMTAIASPFKNDPAGVSSKTGMGTATGSDGSTTAVATAKSDGSRPRTVAGKIPYTFVLVAGFLVFF
jgi:hypothetical protein